MSMTPKQLIEAVYEIAFGEDAHLRGFFPEEVVAVSYTHLTLPTTPYV